MDTYEQTLESFREARALGYSASQVISELEEDENTNSKALEELKDFQRYGV